MSKIGISYQVPFPKITDMLIQWAVFLFWKILGIIGFIEDYIMGFL